MHVLKYFNILKYYQCQLLCVGHKSYINVNLSLFAEHKHVQDVKEEMEDIAICEPSEGLGGGTPGATEASKRSSAKMGPDSNQSTSSKRARVSGEVSQAQTILSDIIY